MTDTGLIGGIVLGLAVLSLLDYLIVTFCVWSAARIFRYRERGWKIPSHIAIYSLKYGLILAFPFALVLYLSNPSLTAVLSKGVRLLLPPALIFLVKTAAFFPEMKTVYGESMKKSVNGYATAVYLIAVAWITVVAIVSMLFGLYGLMSSPLYKETGAGGGLITGWWDLKPMDNGTYDASSNTFSVLYVNDAGRPINIILGQALDIGGKTECNVTSPSPGLEVDNGTLFIFNAACPGSETQPKGRYNILVQIDYVFSGESESHLSESGYFSGNASV